MRTHPTNDQLNIQVVKHYERMESHYISLSESQRSSPRQEVDTRRAGSCSAELESLIFIIIVISLP